MVRFTNLVISASILLLALGVALYQVNRLLHAQLLPSQQLSSSLSQIEQLKHQVQGLLEEALTYREEIKEVKGRALELERGIREVQQKMNGSLPAQKDSDKANAEHHSANIKHHNANIEFSPLKDKSLQASGDSRVHHYFMSALKGHGMEDGPPELFFFPQGTVDPRMLCLRGNSTSDGAQNVYALVEAVPTGAEIVRGVTLISDTFWDFTNPWHSMFNLLQFVYWHVESGCSHADNLLLFHQGEFRTSVGSWITSLLQACGLPTTALSPERVDSHAAICFEQAIVSRNGIGGMEWPLLSRMFKEARCQARRACHIHSVQKSERAFDGRVNVTLMVRHGARGFVDEGAWTRVVKDQCEAALNCSWSVMHVANLTFCQQVEAMTYTDVLVSAHGAQLTNIIFMDPGGSLMEMFPFGWLEMAGHGQFIYRDLASWPYLHHEGYWRDPSTTPCPNLSNIEACFNHYKDQPIGINVTYIGIWLKKVIKKFRGSTLHVLKSSQNHDKGGHSLANTCECNLKW